MALDTGRCLSISNHSQIGKKEEFKCFFVDNFFQELVFLKVYCVQFFFWNFVYIGCVPIPNLGWITFCGSVSSEALILILAMPISCSCNVTISSVIVGIIDAIKLRKSVLHPVSSLSHWHFYCCTDHTWSPGKTFHPNLLQLHFQM